MLNTTTFVGLDVRRSIKAADAMGASFRLARRPSQSGGRPCRRCVYESGVTGFDLQKKLAALGVDCVVGAVSKMIKPPGRPEEKERATDAGFLARMLSVGSSRGPGPMTNARRRATWCARWTTQGTT